MYTDEIKLLYESNMLNNHALNNELNHIASWLVENQLHLKSSMTQKVIFLILLLISL